MASPAKRKHICSECKKAFSTASSLKKHLINIHKEDLAMERRKQQICPVCLLEVGPAMKNLQHHLQTIHSHKIKEQSLIFNSEIDFSLWKTQEEKDTKSSFVKQREDSKKRHGYIMSYYYCHRTGYYATTGTGKRKLKNKGSNKINASCPAQMKVKKLDNGRVHVVYVKTHVGHTLDVGRLHLTEDEKKVIANKLAKNISITEILNDIKSSSASEDERIRLLTRRDVINISHQYNLNQRGMFNINDATSVGVWVKHLSEDDSSVLCYKARGELIEDFSPLLKDDFLLVLMNSEQRELFVRFGSDVVCIDSRRATNANDFALTTILIVDDKNEGFPIASIFSNKQDEKTMEIAFKFIKATEDDFTTKTVMTDVDDVQVNAWTKVFGRPINHLWCIWHTDRAWRKNLKLISSLLVQAEVYSKLRRLLCESDENEFNRMLEEAIRDLTTNPETANFAQYFITHYSNLTEKWASSYCRWLGKNTIMSLERIYRTLKYKKVKRMDKSIHAVCKFVADKLLDRSKSLSPDKISSKQAMLRHGHETSKLNWQNVTAKDDYWLVKSTSADKIYYEVRKRRNCSKKCSLMCYECNFCLHAFRCNCIDNCIKTNMCQHIHKVCQFLNESSIETQLMESNDNSLIMTDHDYGEGLVVSHEVQVEDTSDDQLKQCHNEFVHELNDAVVNCDPEDIYQLMTEFTNKLKALKRPYQQEIGIVCNNSEELVDIDSQRLIFKAKKLKFDNTTTDGHLVLEDGLLLISNI